MSKAIRNCTLRLYPTAKQARQLESWLELHRLLYNQSLAERRDAWCEGKRSVSYNEQQNALPAMKEEKPWYLPLGSHALQETVRRVDRGFKAFFRRLKSGQKPGYPRFKAKDRFDSFTYPCVAGWKLTELSSGRGVLAVTNLGHIKLKGTCRVNLLGLDRKQMTCCTIRRNRGKWYTTITYHTTLSALARPVAEDPESMTGLDAGLKSLGVLADGTEILRKRHLNEDAAMIKAASRSISRKMKGSANRRKAVRELSRIHGRVANRRKDYLDKTAAKIVSTTSFLAVEDLAVKNMMAKGGMWKRGLNKSMADAALGRFLIILGYKAEEAGCQFVRVNPRGTTQDCSRCGETVLKTLSDRIHNCPHCGLVMDRDQNAAINILFRGLALAGREPSAVWRDVRLGPKAEQSRRSTKPHQCVMHSCG